MDNGPGKMGVGTLEAGPPEIPRRDGEAGSPTGDASKPSLSHELFGGKGRSEQEKNGIHLCIGRTKSESLQGDANQPMRTPPGGRRRVASASGARRGPSVGKDSGRDRRWTPSLGESEGRLRLRDCAGLA